nr:probable E3 ubiquitin-protein ligase HECTD4 [Lytechinus pictus]
MAIGNTAHQEKKMDKNSSQPHDVVTDLLASHIKDKSEKSCENYLTKLRIPAPWAAGKTVETIHPVRDNYKFRETVHIPGARCLYLRFEPRCASQYDYDKGDRQNGPMMTEGNTHSVQRACDASNTQDRKCIRYTSQ